MTSPKTIALISRADARGGGASRVADDIWRALTGDPEFHAERYIGEFSRTAPATHRPIDARAKKVLREIRRILKRRGYVDHAPVELPFLHRGILGADIVHAHDITTVMAPATLYLLARMGRRVIWTLHDMSAITGGCIYPIGCGGWRDGCGDCPMLDQWPFQIRKDRTRKMQARRLSVLGRKKLELVSPSQWLANHVEAAVPGTHVRVIPNGVELDTFTPGAPPPDPERAKLLFVANHIGDMRKGGTYLSDIRHHLEATGRNLDLLMIGSGSDGEVVREGRLTIRYLGRFDDKRELAAAYRLADGLLLPTHADNFPLVMLEAMACGLPVFGFDTGGIAEAVDETCGAIRPAGDIGGVLDAFFTACDTGAMAALGAAGRARAEARYSMQAFADAHRALYRAQP